MKKVSRLMVGEYFVIMYYYVIFCNYVLLCDIVILNNDDKLSRENGAGVF